MRWAGDGCGASPVAEVAMPEITAEIVELIRSVSTDLSPDVEQAILAAHAVEEPGAAAEGALQSILENIRLSRSSARPICQDTGTPMFHVWNPEGTSQRDVLRQIRAAVRIATERAYLRPNAVAAISGKNSGDNTGIDFPTVHFEEWGHDYLQIGLLLKGGGSENCGCQYTVPSPEFEAGRDLAGVRKAVLDAAHRAQGFGCAPGVLGVGVGGDRVTGMLKAKEQLFRPLGDTNPGPELDALEKQLTREINELGIGPMGFGGKTTVLGVKIAELHRLPASFFVSIAYMCWADRRKVMTIKEGNVALLAAR
jgi:fumarate hydratase, class I